MDPRADLIARANAFCAETGITKARLGDLVLKDNKFFAQLEHGGRHCTTKTYSRFLAWFQERSQDAA